MKQHVIGRVVVLLLASAAILSACSGDANQSTARQPTAIQPTASQPKSIVQGTVWMDG